MTLTDFIRKYDGQTVDFDGNHGGQCVDVYRAYCKEVLNIPQSPPVKGAKDIAKTYLPDYFDWTGNREEGVPQPGDIVIWGDEIGPYGHVAIFVDGTNRSFRSFDQNYPLGSKCHLQAHRYTGVLGWLHFKGTPLTDMTEEQQKVLQILADYQHEAKHGNLEGAARAAVDAAREVQKVRQDMAMMEKDFQLKYNSAIERIGELTEEIGKTKEALSKWQKKLTTANQQITELTAITEQHDGMVARLNEWERKSHNPFECLKLLIQSLKQWKK
jgi:hypothetical protein